MFSSSNLRAFCSDNVAADTTALTSLTPTPPPPISRSCAHARRVCAGVPIALTLALTFSDVLHCAAQPASTLRQLRDSCAKWLMISSPEPSSGSSATLGPQRCRCAYQLRPRLCADVLWPHHRCGDAILWPENTVESIGIRSKCRCRWYFDLISMFFDLISCIFVTLGSDNVPFRW